MATYIMSDLHGMKAEFDMMLHKINFSDNDELYILGDVIDRGPCGADLLMQIMDMPNVHLLMGNHEAMLQEVVHTAADSQEEADANDLWCYNGGYTTAYNLQEYSTVEQQKIFDFIDELPYEADITVNGKKYRLVHAAPHEIADICRYPVDVNEIMVWDRKRMVNPQFRRKLKKMLPDTTIIVGHTPTASIDNGDGKIVHSDNIMYIDCGCAILASHPEVNYANLGCLRLDDMQEFYVSSICKRNINQREVTA